MYGWYKRQKVNKWRDRIVDRLLFIGKSILLPKIYVLPTLATGHE